MGAAAIDALLCHPELKERWTVAAYVADNREWMTPEERKEEQSRSLFAHAFGRMTEGASERAERARRAMAAYGRMAKDSRQFVHAGFKELKHDVGQLFKTKGMMSTPPLTHEAALAVPLVVAAKSTGVVADVLPVPSVGKDAKFNELIRNWYGDASPDLLARIDALISEGARPTEAHALHCAAATGDRHPQALFPAHRAWSGCQWQRRRKYHTADARGRDGAW